MLSCSTDRLKALLWISQTGQKNNSRVFEMGSGGYNQISVDSIYSTQVLSIGVLQVRAKVGWEVGG